MPLPPPLAALIQKRHFWAHYFFGDGSDQGDSEGRNYPGLRDCRVEFHFTDENALILSLDEYLCQITLSFSDIDLPEPEVIGWDDQAHWIPHVLRWQELDLICRCTALDDPTLPHPGIPLLLLYRFAPICVGDETADRFTALGAAWRSLGIFSEPEIDGFVRRFDHRDHGFRWIYSEPEGCTIDQEREGRGSHWLYTTRFIGSETFPFEYFNSAIEEAEAQYVRAIEVESASDPSAKSSREHS